MKVKLLNMYCSPEGTHQVGAVVELSNKEAEMLIERNYAEKYSADVTVETTSEEISNVETASKPERKRKGKY